MIYVIVSTSISVCKINNSMTNNAMLCIVDYVVVSNVTVILNNNNK